MHFIIDLLLHTGDYLQSWSQQYGALVYVIIFLVLFCETGLVVTPFLPGDSLLFVAGTLCATTALTPEPALNIFLLLIVAITAAILGDACNYFIGKKIGQAMYDRNTFKMRGNIDKTQEFFKKHGGKTIIIARFMPIIRTFAPFVAGTGKMKYSRFLSFNAAGAIMWVFVACLAGFFFGNIPFVQQHFTEVLYAIVFISLCPIIITKIVDMIKKRSSSKISK